ncbi:hypothetical protein E8E13_007044 [Curvularia kusanoi]|uniref:Uncharacterized protein n=1 Tax=Curvularia kusanoi TaxID=90978 RepID=A0A9P4T9S7_CURKU|nr:hypothetical protein E8E13_007044 [Curvularia kusanoi]
MFIFKGDPFSKEDCILLHEFRLFLMRQSPPEAQKLIIASHDLVEFAQKVNFDIDAFDNSVVGFASLREFWAESIAQIYHEAPLPDFWDWQASSTLAPFLHFISNCGTYWNNECKDEHDPDLFVEVEQHGDKIHVLLARCSTMVCCNYQDDEERTYYWRNRNPDVYEVDNFAELLQLVQQLCRRETPNFPRVNIFPRASSSDHALAVDEASLSDHALAVNEASSSPQKPSRMYVPPHLRKAVSQSNAEDEKKHSMYTPPHLRPGAKRPQITSAFR